MYKPATGDYGANSPVMKHLSLLLLLLALSCAAHSQDTPQLGYYELQHKVDSLENQFKIMKSNLQAGGVDLSVGSKCLISSVAPYAVGAVLLAIAPKFKGQTRESLQTGGYAAIGIGGVVSITGLAYLINGSNFIAGRRAVKDL